MNYQVAKSFDRDGTRYRPGDDLPEGLDKVAIAHYQRHGMIREAPAPGTTKPAGPAQASVAAPGRKRESAKPKDVKAAPSTATGKADAPVATAETASTAADGSATPDQGGASAAPAADAAAADTPATDGAGSSEASGDGTAASQPQDPAAGAANV